MCRFAAYLGEPVLIEDLLFEPDGALVRQAVESELMSHLNLGGFGLAAWTPDCPDPGRPLTYRVPTLPNFDRNLRALAGKIRAGALVAHVRGVLYDSREGVGAHNVHPFLFDGAGFTLAQNGDLYDFASMRYDLLEHLDPGIAARIEGTTDTEWVYALVLSQLEQPFGPVGAEEAALAVTRALEILRELRERRGIATQSPVNLVLTDGIVDARDAIRLRLRVVSRRRLVLRRRARARLHLALVHGRRPLRPSRGRQLRSRRRAGDLRRRRQRAADQAHLRLAGGARVLDARADAHRRRRARRRDRRAGLVSALTPTGDTPLALRDMPLFSGIALHDVARLEHFMARFEAAPGDHLFRQGDHSDMMHLIERGRVEVQVETHDGRLRALARLGPGQLLGEISLLGADKRTASAVALEPTSGWMLFRAAFETLRLDAGAGSVELMARIAELAVARLRARYEAIALELDADADAGPGTDAAAARAAPRAEQPASPELYAPDYLHSLLCFREFHDHEQIAAAIGDAQPYELARGATIDPSDRAGGELLLVLRGAVDVSVRRGATAQRVRLAGPGRFVGHIGVLDSGPSPVVAHARERVVLVALAGERLRAMLRDPSAVARRFSAAIAEDAARALRQAERPMARTSLGGFAAGESLAAAR